VGYDSRVIFIFGAFLVPRVWLPPGTTWDDIRPDQDRVLTNLLNVDATNKSSFHKRSNWESSVNADGVAFATVSFSFGLFVMWDKPWFWDLKLCWYDYPHQSVPNDVWWYYLFGGSYYCSLLLTQVFIDTKRKDFWEMLVHHVVTIFLIGFSWTCNLIRIGTVVYLFMIVLTSF
ncbi:Ceramide synthase hyl-1, partial [Orchesella cincta]